MAVSYDNQGNPITPNGYGVMNNSSMPGQATPNPLQGSVVGGLFGQSAGLQNQSSIPSIGGQNQYAPGNGMAPYAPGQMNSDGSQGGMSPAMAQQIMNSPSASPENKLAAQQSLNRQSSVPSYNASGSQLSTPGTSSSGGPMSSYPGGTPGAPQQSGAGAPPQSGLTTTIGQSNAWMTPDQLRAATNSLGNGTASGTGGIGSSGTGAAGSKPASAPTGAGQIPQGLLNGSTNQATPGQINIGSAPAGTAGSANDPGTTTYGPPGSQPQSPTGSGSLTMQQQSPGQALSDYQNTAGYQNVNAPGAYQQSPGYQFATTDAMRQLQANASSNGLLQSGSALRAATNQAQGMAQQDYTNWWNRQNSQFDAYANRLAGLAGGNVGADQAMANGTALSNGTTNTGQNIAGLLGSQGTAGYGGLVNTGAAQSSNIGNAATQQAQVNSANQSTQLAGAVYNRGLF